MRQFSRCEGVAWQLDERALACWLMSQNERKRDNTDDDGDNDNVESVREESGDAVSWWRVGNVDEDSDEDDDEFQPDSESCDEEDSDDEDYDEEEQKREMQQEIDQVFAQQEEWRQEGWIPTPVAEEACPYQHFTNVPINVRFSFATTSTSTHTTTQHAPAINFP